VNLRDQVLSSLRWLSAVRFSGQLVSWAITIVVIRLLRPEDYGLMALATLVIGAFQLVNEVGLGSALVQKEELDQRMLEQVYGLLLATGVALYLVAFLAAPSVAGYFEEPQLTPILRVAGLQLLLMPLEVVPRSMLQRRMEFRKKSLVEFAAMLATSLSTLGLVLLGMGVWALVLGEIVSVFARVAGTRWAARHPCRPRFSLGGLRAVVAFGGVVTADRILWFVYSRTDVFVIGKLLGKEPLGAYSVAVNLASLPTNKISGILSEVGFSAFSRIQDDRPQVARQLRRVVRVLAFTSFPVFTGIAAIAPELVEVALGDEWRLAIFPLQALALIGPLGMLGGILMPALMGVGRPDLGLRARVIACILMPGAFLVGARWGLDGVAMAWLIVYPVQFLVVLALSLPVLGLTIRAFLSEMALPLLASAVMGVAVIATRGVLEGWMVPGWAVLSALVLVGAGVYLASTAALGRRLFTESLDLLRG